jgi:hypothetical protein
LLPFQNFNKNRQQHEPISADAARRPNMRLKTLGILRHTVDRQWTVEFHDEFFAEFKLYPVAVRREVYALAELLARFGPQLGRPRVDTLKGAKLRNLKELRFQADDGVWRIAFAFDVKRKAILLAGGDKSGVSQSRFYRNLIEIAERRFEQHQKATAKDKENE